MSQPSPSLGPPLLSASWSPPLFCGIVHVALDDFTFHHNSMRWLGSSALKFLKLDAKITAVAMKERVPQAMVVAIAQASKVLGLSCVAKRVDTPAVREWLSAVGLDYAQGFLLDQPKPLISLTKPARK